jgi:hypothetical protein
VPNKPRTQGRSIRIPDPVWDGVLRLGAIKGETATAIVVRALEDHLHREGIRIEGD